MVPSVIAISYSRPVRLSRMLRDAALAGSTVGVSVIRPTYAWPPSLNRREPYDLDHWRHATLTRGGRPRYPGRLLRPTPAIGAPGLGYRMRQGSFPQTKL